MKLSTDAFFNCKALLKSFR